MERIDKVVIPWQRSWEPTLTSSRARSSRSASIQTTLSTSSTCRKSSRSLPGRISTGLIRRSTTSEARGIARNIIKISESCVELVLCRHVPEARTEKLGLGWWHERSHHPVSQQRGLVLLTVSQASPHYSKLYTHGGYWWARRARDCEQPLCVLPPISDNNTVPHRQSIQS